VDRTVDPEGSFAFFAFLGKNVSLERFLVGNLPCTGHLEPFLGAGVGFNLWHLLYFTFTPCWRSALAETYGALWAIPD
jgi:hypothetical protein